MRIGFRAAWEGTNRKVASCPICGASRVRYSRRTYDGFWALIFKTRPVRCLECGVYFPIAVRSSIPPDVELVDLQLPFRPSELDAPLGLAPVRTRPAGVTIPFSGPGAGNCPDCGSSAIRPARFSAEISWRRPDVREPWRCIDCNASFARVNPRRVIALIAIVLGLLLGVAYLAHSLRGGPGGGGKAPTIRQNQVPKLPPPVFR